MGFGTLFIGFCLLFNIAYPAYTDAVSAAVMFLGLYRLAAYNRPMRAAAVADAGFLLLGLTELADTALSLFSGKSFLSGSIGWIFPFTRYLVVGALTVCILLGIHSLACEVNLKKLAGRCEGTLALPILTSLSGAILELPLVAARADVRTTAIIANVVILFSVVCTVIHLVTIYKAYMHICLPGDLDMQAPPSRFAFINRMRERAEAREQEESARRLAESQARNQKRKDRKKKK